MAKTRVYLSKSNESDPQLVARIRHFLQNTYDIELVEFKGGVYNNKSLIDSNLLLVIPPGLPWNDTIDNEEDIEIGKGQFTQICDFIQAKDPYGEADLKHLILVLTGTDFEDDDIKENTLRVSEFLDVKLVQTTTWQSGYGLVTTNGLDCCLNSFYQFGAHKKSNPSSYEKVTEAIKIHRISDDYSESMSKSVDRVTPILAVSAFYL